jgi:RNA polymerase sigma-70 factor (ECF subfamily)
MSCRTLSDIELADLLKSGDHDAFTEIYNRYYGVLYAHALRLLHDGDDVSDILHELFINLWVKRTELSLTPSLSAYLYRSVKNRVINAFEKSRVRQSYLDSLQYYINTGSQVTEETIRVNELALQIENEVARLPGKMREIFELSRKYQLSHKEIADTLGISDKTVKKQINNVIHRLRMKINMLIFSNLL